jgi:hypothetical protein
MLWRRKINGMVLKVKITSELVTPFNAQCTDQEIQVAPQIVFKKKYYHNS